MLKGTSLCLRAEECSPEQVLQHTQVCFSPPQQYRLFKNCFSAVMYFLYLLGSRKNPTRSRVFQIVVSRVTPQSDSWEHVQRNF